MTRDAKGPATVQPTTTRFAGTDNAESIPGLYRVQFSRGQAIGLPRRPGRWQTKSLLVFDAQERALTRRIYTVWNSLAVSDLDFSWIPESVGTSAPGRIEGSGRLIWRPADKPAYDRSVIVAEYAGKMLDGKPHGKGVYFERDGFHYEGDWSDGQFQGSGRLMLPNGDEYVGKFAAGKADGEGLFFQADGEIYSGGFRNGLRDGDAEITSPTGQTYRSRWIAGEEVVPSRGIRIAQLGAASVGSDDVGLGILVDRQPLKDGMLGYAASNTTDGLKIRPADQRLMDLWKGDAQIQLTEQDQFGVGKTVFAGGEFDNNLFGWSADAFPGVLLIVDVENRSTDSVQIADAYLDVSRSSSDFEPLVVIPTGTSFQGCRTQYDPKFTIQNFGWASLEGASLNLSVANNIKAFSKQLGLVRAIATVSVEENLRAFGVDVAKLKRQGEQAFSCASKSESECLSEVVRSGVFGTVAPHVYRENSNVLLNLDGSLQYGWTNSDGQKHHKQSRFKVQVVLGTLVGNAECEGGGVEPIKTSEPLMLGLDKTGYRVPLRLQTGIAAGRVRRYSLPVRAPKCSRHQFRVVLVRADGREIRSRPIDLLYFFPNMWAHKFD